MEDKESIKAKPPKKTLRKIIIILLGLFLFLVIFIIFAVPAILSSGKVSRIILSKINQAVEGKTEFSDLSVGWLKGVNIEDFSYDDNAGWISVKVKSISTKPKYGSLITGNFNLGQTQVDTPQVEIDLNKKPVTQVKSSTNQPKQTTTTQTAAFALTTDIRLKDGNVKLTGTDSKTVAIEQINSNVNIKPPGEQSSFNLGMIVAANNEKSNIEAKGEITPTKKSGWTLKGANSQLTVTVNKLDIESLGPFFALANIDVQAKGDISVDLKGQLQDGQMENLTGVVKGSNIDISGSALKGDSIKTKVLDADVKLTRKDQMISIDKMNVKTDWASVDASGELPTTINSLDSLLASDSKTGLNAVFNCNVAELVSQMPKTLGLKEGTTITSGSIDGDISTTGTSGQKQIQAVAQLTDLKGLVEGKEIALSAPVKLQALVSPDKSGININKMDLTASFASLDCSGNLESIKYNAKTDLTKLQSELGQFIDFSQYQVAGAFSSDGTVSIADENISAAGVMQLNNMKLSKQEKGSVSEPKADVNFVLDWDRKTNIVSTQNIKANASFGQVDIKSAKVQLNTGSTLPVDADVMASDIDLSKLKPYAIMFSSLPKEMNIFGIAQSEILVNTQKQTYIIKSDSTKIKNLKITYPEKKPFDQNDVSFVFDTKINPEEETYEINFKLDSPPDIHISYGRFSQQSTNDNSMLRGNINCEFDWAVLSTLASNYLPEDLTIKGKRKDMINFSSEYPIGKTDKLLANLDASADLGFEQADYMGLVFGPTDVNIAVNNGLLTITPFSTVVNEGKFNFGAQADFKKDPALFEINKPTKIAQNIKINDDTTQKLLKYLNPIFANASNVTGIANFICQKLDIPLSSAAKNNALIVGTISIDQLKLQTSEFLAQIINLCGGNKTGTVLTIHPTDFTLKDGYLRYDDMQIDVDKYPVNFAGVIGLDKSLNMTVTLPYTSSGKTIRVGQQSVNRITLPIKGTLDKPELDLGKLLENTLQNELENQLRKGLEDLFGF